ncbi:Chalcone-flavanone isomerase [Delftia tsuruhatensis]|uniref:chalcone isomerase family protein n=1 Tax=Delftia tsuruhatensis TaxID=180282 RepID=UPI001E6B45A6|nr:chalcone isomerase family protein [Delftia tsuruhatensis]CAB5699724.1 Chalcone-flavanone isomerase [Delftia tsuruhatensis]CAC9693636.1 Chalcone-flavanone isomerase [Delftia tsuruhatensis]
MTALPRWMKTAALAVALAMPLAAAAQEPARTVGGVAYPVQAGVGGQTLQLNGAGIRYKAIFKVYTAGLYLEKPAASLQEIAALPGPKRVSVTMLREIDSAELGKLFARGIEDNMERARFSRLVPGVLRMSDIFTQHKKLLPGENFSVDWVPGQGAQVFVKGQAQGAPFQEPEFFQALLGIWLGPHPADDQLKKALLGG